MSNLSAEVTLSSSKLAEVEAKLKSYESSEVDHNSRVESLEAELIKKQAENEGLKNQAIALEQKASSSKQKALLLARMILKRDKYSKDLSDAASKLIEDSSGFGKSKDQGADLLMFPSSS
ncbi:hypothetical protein Pint_31673 [Pistacia integerrima]|uniref:Uncharacterized protein n=1 Tax=Pistacia integerrima TaxID=434235 RepID=A0ACC0XPG9_9ROSI|nr:hypothetical protein Pint_31673 [Pistacia integerrima]